MEVPNSSKESAHVLVDSKGDILWVYISYENTVLSRVSKKVNVNLEESIIAFKAS